MADGIENGKQMEELEFYPIEEPGGGEECFDIDFEFDAPRCYDFGRLETDWEVQEAELWFDSAGSYPPSPFVLKLNWRYGVDGNEECGNSSIDYDDRESCNCSSEDNDLMAKTNSGVKSSLFRSSTLMKPTASYLAKQNQYRVGHHNQFERRFQKFLARLDDKGSKSSSVAECNSTKRQKLEASYLCKVAYLTHQAVFMHKKPQMARSVDGNSIHAKPKVTIPREPELQTAIRAERRRSRVSAELDEKEKSRAHVFKARPLNRKILEAPSFPFPKKSLPQPPEFQLFHFRTSERARQHACKNTKKLPDYVSTSRKGNTGLRRFNSIDVFKDEKCEAVKTFKACPSSKKIISSKRETGFFQNIKRETTAPMEFKILADRKLPDEAPIDSLNKLSLSSEVRCGEKSIAKLALSEGFKENDEPAPFLLQRQIMNVAKRKFAKEWRDGISVQE